MCPLHPTGNLLVLRDGRVGFIDFGIVGSVSPATWTAVRALFAAVATDDMETAARALATMGATDRVRALMPSKRG